MGSGGSRAGGEASGAHRGELRWPRAASSASISLAERVNPYQQITDRIIAQFEVNCVPWIRPWDSVRGTATVTMPRNATTARAYSGIKVMLFWDAAVAKGYTNPRWLSFNQARIFGNVCVTPPVTAIGSRSDLGQPQPILPLRPSSAAEVSRPRHPRRHRPEEGASHRDRMVE
ncbi:MULTISPECIES: ArdC-like ssDNA-binding domain-containing protein [unclassified Methylobacterium]|jgi:N-terminal domain of anti-restriction factor ArdC|uniref:ArdC-like ssDNA-binding domain-containing protein n=1 Tax=unclassified Methylobacterium TaxID=2615210 RepID=UPI001FF0620F|nr:ArdC family protein [Methylobacterium sp. 2A]